MGCEPKPPPVGPPAPPPGPPSPPPPCSFESLSTSPLPRAVPPARAGSDRRYRDFRLRRGILYRGGGRTVGRELPVGITGGDHGGAGGVGLPGGGGSVRGRVGGGTQEVRLQAQRRRRLHGRGDA